MSRFFFVRFSGLEYFSTMDDWKYQQFHYNPTCLKVFFESSDWWNPHIIKTILRECLVFLLELVSQELHLVFIFCFCHNMVFFWASFNKWWLLLRSSQLNMNDFDDIKLKEPYNQAFHLYHKSYFLSIFLQPLNLWFLHNHFRLKLYFLV